MKRIILAFILVSSFGMNNSFAQDAKKPTPMVRVGDVPYRSATVTREELLANPRLTAQTPTAGCQVTSFVFGMFPKGHDYIGPFTVTGSSLTPQLIKMIENLEDPQGKLFFENIKIKCGSEETTVQPMLLNMTLKKQ